MADPNIPGKETSEWTVVKWVTWICGILATILTGVLASGAVTDPAAVSVLGAVVAILAAVGGVSTKEYIKGRSNIKAAKAYAEAEAKAGKENPTG